VAIVQISQITNRKGLAENLPQLAGAEFGWSTDTRQLWIGNGTLEDGAPVIGNTEILTEFSDILNFTTTYTYKGQAAGYTVQTGPTPGTPVTQSLQSWLDQFATVKDFGAIGDGIADDTAAINRALYQLFCRESNPQIRRSLFFPAGVYRVTGTINIPPYATLYGEGLDNSMIVMDPSVAQPVGQTADSLQQTGANIGSGGAIPPQYITISNMGFQNRNATVDVFSVQDATNCRFQNVNFVGPLTAEELSSGGGSIKGVSFGSTISYVCDQIVFDGCKFSGTTWASSSNQQIKGIVFSNCKLDTLYRGFEFGTGTLSNGGPSGIRIVHNLFDNIYAEGIIIGDISLNATGYNIFYDVGNQLFGAGSPAYSIIDIQSSNNISISDMFDRNDTDALAYPRISINNTTSIATTNGSQLSMGSYTRNSGLVADLTAGISDSIDLFDTTQFLAAKVDYTINQPEVSPTAFRTGTIMISSNGLSSNLTWTDDYVENADTSIVLAVSQTGTTVSLDYSSSSLYNGSIFYSINYLA
jgi:hypothetical protein